MISVEKMTNKASKHIEMKEKLERNLIQPLTKSDLIDLPGTAKILENTCIVCNKNPIQMLYLPCRHNVICETCNQYVLKAHIYKCIYCGKDIYKRKKINDTLLD